MSLLSKSPGSDFIIIKRSIMKKFRIFFFFKLKLTENMKIPLA